jgi:hypothetical protein
MNARQQLELFGLCAYADEDKVVIVAKEDAAELDPYVARRFAFYLARAYHDALRHSRRAGTTWGPTTEPVS